MLLFENIQLALNGLWANKMRALLTMLGIIIGIGSVIAIMTVARQPDDLGHHRHAELGAGNITVSLTQKSAAIPRRVRRRACSVRPLSARRTSSRTRCSRISARLYGGSL